MSKKGSLKIDHLSLKKSNKNKRNLNNKTIIKPTKEIYQKYNKINELIKNEESKSLNDKIEQSLTNFISAKSSKQQLISFQELVRIKWDNDNISSIIKTHLFQFCLLICMDSLNRDFIKILCRLLDKLAIYPQSILQLSIISLFDSMIKQPKIHYIETLTKLLLCSFFKHCIIDNHEIIWKIIHLLQTLLNELLLNVTDSNNLNINMNIDDNDKSIDFRLPQNKQTRLSLLGRDIVAAFWLFLTNNCKLIKSLIQNAMKAMDKDKLIIVENLLQTCNNLMSISTFHKDAITKIVFLHHFMITLIYIERDEQIKCFKSIINLAINNDDNNDNNNKYETKIEKIIYDNWNKVCSLSLMGFIRAIITQSNIDILQYELIDICYNIIIDNWCNENNSNLRLYAFDTICGWITVNINILKQIEKESKSINDISYFDHNNFNDKLEEIKNLIETNFEHQSRAISFMIEIMMERYIELMDKYNLIKNKLDNKLMDKYWIKQVENAMNLSIQEKGRYLRLKVLIKRVGSLNIFEKYPNWIMRLLQASTIIGGTAVSLIHQSLNLAKQEMIKDSSKQYSMTKWRNLWMDPICKGFIHENEQIQRISNTDLLKYIIKIDPKSYFPLIEHLLKSNDCENINMWQINKLRSLIGILKSGKRNGIITNNIIQQWLNDDNNDNNINKRLLYNCLLHNDDEIRMQSLEIICCSKLSTDIPSKNEFELLKSILPFWIKLQLSKHRDQFIQLIQKLLSRIRNGCYKILHASNDKMNNNNQDIIENCLNFIKWFRNFLLNNLYPSSPVERTSTCIMIYYFLLKIWNNNDDNKDINDILEIPLLTNDRYFINILINCMMNGWDQVRLISYKILQLLPSPIYGFETKQSIIKLLKKSLILTSSPRLLQSDCGALLLSIIFNKYVKELKYSFHLLSIYDNNNNNNNDNNCVKTMDNTEDAILSFLEGFNEILSKHISIISIIPFHERYRSSHDRVHGLLTFFREILVNLNLKTKWNTEYRLHEKWKKIMNNILKNIFEIGEISLILHIRDPTEKEIENPTINKDVKLIGIDCRGHAQFTNLNDDYCDQQMEQMIVVSSWLTIKESCLCLAKFVEHCPLQNKTINLLNVDMIENIGNFFLKTLQDTRHNGVMEKAYSGFTILCKSLLGSNIDTLINIVNKWLNKLLNIVKNESIKHWIRRSAGFPFSFMSILEAEFKVITNDRKLFKYTMDQLIINIKNDKMWQSKVVSLNIIMFIFRNSIFNLVVIPYISQIFKIVLFGLSHKQWAVRNSSILCLSCIISRAIKKSDHVMKIDNIKKFQTEKNMNVLKEYIQVNNEENEFFISSNINSTSIGITADIFFNQHPDLHSFLLQYLQDTTTEITKTTKTTNPSLFPILLLLSKLSPRDVNSKISTNPFKQYIIKCTGHKNQRIRLMSARSLMSIISNENLLQFLCKLINKLPDNINMIQSMNELDGLLLQIKHIVNCCDDFDIVDKILPILMSKLWILNCIEISLIIHQSLIIICISTLKSIFNSNTKQSEIVTLYLMKLYKSALCILSTKQETDIGHRRLRSFAAKLLLETLLLTHQYCIMDESQITKLCCILLNDKDELVIESSSNCLSSLIVYFKDNNSLLLIKNKVNWSQLLLLCIKLLKHSSTRFGKRLSSIIKLFNDILFNFDLKYLEKLFIDNQITIKSLWCLLYDIAMNNKHFIVEIMAMQSLGKIVNISLKILTAKEMIKSILKDWIDILEKFSNENSPEELRTICVSAIEISNIFQICNHTQYKQEIIDLWMIIINLLQDFEMPIRNITANSISFLTNNKHPLIPNYCIKIIFNHLEIYYKDNDYFLNKMLNIIINPNVWYNKSKWFDNNMNEFKLFLPERPNDAFEPLLLMQFATNILIKYTKNNKNFDIVNLININVINNILSKMKQITQNDDNNNSDSNYDDAQTQLICNNIFMIYWFSMFYCYLIISVSTNDKLCSQLMNILKSELEKLKSKYNDSCQITINFCDKLLKELENRNSDSCNEYNRYLFLFLI